MILLIDNYDSFTYNIYQVFAQISPHIKVVRNDQLTIEKVKKMKNLKAIVIGPGPGHPKDSGLSLSVIEQLYKDLPILGVCLGHQAIGLAFGAKITRLSKPLHGKLSLVNHDNKGLFEGLPNPLNSVRYHSLIVSPSEFPSQLKQTAQTADGVIMGIKHKRYPLYGVQFHPESYANERGIALLNNFYQRHCK